MLPPHIIVVTGLPCTGKTTLAIQIATHFDLPLITKDGIKEIMFDVLGCEDRSHSKQMSRATMEIMFHLMAALLAGKTSLVVVANFLPELSRPQFQGLISRFDCQLIEVLCVTTGDILLERFKNRQRHPGHLDNVVFKEMKALVAKNETNHLALGEALIEVDTSDFAQVNVSEIFSQIETALQT